MPCLAQNKNKIFPALFLQLKFTFYSLVKAGSLRASLQSSKVNFTQFVSDYAAPLLIPFTCNVKFFIWHPLISDIYFMKNVFHTKSINFVSTRQKMKMKMKMSDGLFRGCELCADWCINLFFIKFQFKRLIFCLFACSFAPDIIYFN